MAPAISGFSSWMAAVRITRSQSFRFSAEWPMATSMPWDRSWRTVPLSVMSEPCTRRPMPSSTSARGHILTPPMPARWARTPGLRKVLISMVGCIILGPSRIWKIRILYYTIPRRSVQLTYPTKNDFCCKTGKFLL